MPENTAERKKVLHGFPWENGCRIHVVSSDAFALRDPFSFLRVRANKGNELPSTMKALAMAIKGVPLLLHGNS